MKRSSLSSLCLCALAACLWRCGGDNASVTTRDDGLVGSYDLESNPHPIMSANPHEPREYLFDGDTEVLPSALSQRVAASSPAAGWLVTKKNHIYRADGSLFMARGANIFDTRMCDLCTYMPANNADVLRRVDTLLGSWSGDFIRFNLESFTPPNGRLQYKSIMDDPAYLADVVEMVKHVQTTSPRTYILLTLFVDPSFDAHNIPNANTAKVWSKLATTFLKYPNVMFGVANEPHAVSNDSAAQIAGQGAQVHAAMTLSVKAIRAVEDAAKSPHHIIAVQGTTGWSRNISYYITHPIKSDNIVYEVHPYDKSTLFYSEIVIPAKTLPVIVGEFGLVTEWKNSMSLGDAVRMMDVCDALSIPYAGWAMTTSCGIPLLQKTAKDACGIGSSLVPTSWGRVLVAHLRAMQGRSAGVAAPTTGTLATVMNTDLCLHDSGYGTANAVNATLATCSFADPATTWTIKPNRTLAVGNGKRCLARSSDGRAPIIRPCDGGAAQTFKATGGRFQTPNNRCLYVPNGTLANGSKLTLGSCNNIGKGYWQMF